MAEIGEIYVCEICGMIVETLSAGNGILTCCGVEMVQQKENTVDAAKEKHVPAVTVDGNRLTVQIGSTIHPMTSEHYIEWIEVREKGRVQRAVLKPGDEPKAEFCTNGGEVSVRAYCNLHGLWKA